MTTSKTTTRTRRKTSTEVAKLSPAAASVLFGGSEDTFYEDLAVLRKLADQIIDSLPRLPRAFAMSQASIGFAHVTSEPESGLPEFTVPCIPGFTGVVAVVDPGMEIVDAEVIA